MWRIVAAGVALEAGCLWIWLQSPGLTAIYNADYTREFFAHWPALSAAAIATAPDDALSMVAALEAGLLVMSLGYLGGLLALRRAADEARWVVFAFALVFRLTFTLVPGLFSTDLFSYVMYGRIAAVYGQNPYLHSPGEFAADPFESWVFAFWRDQPTVYGAAWTDFSWLLSSLTSQWTNFDQVMAYRLSLTACELLTLALLWRLLGRLPRGDRLQAFAMYAWSPLVLFDLVGASHNDAAMLPLLLLGLVPFARPSRQPLGLALLVLSAMVKYATGVVAVVATVAWARAAQSARARLTRFLIAAVLAAGIGLGVWWPWLQQPQALLPLADAAGGRLVINSAPDLAALTIADQVLVPLGTDATEAQAVSRAWLRAIARAAFAAYLAWELWRVWRRPTFDTIVRASTRALVILPLLVLTWVWSWYFSWPLILAPLLGRGARLARLVVAYTVAAPPLVYAHQYLNEQLPGGFVLLLAVGPLLVLCYSGIHRPTAQPQPVPAGDR